jgi:hypothetical protein
MRVALKTPDGLTHWLAGQPGVDEREFSSVSGFRVGGTVKVQPDGFPRAEAMVFRDRKNLATSLSFGTTRKFASLVAAAEWALDYDAAKPRSGTLILETPQAGGGVSRRYMAGAVVQPPGREVIGVSVILTYDVVGGKILTTPPAGELP